MTDLNRQLALAQIRFTTLHELTRMIDRSEHEILEFSLEAGVRATDSEIGYIYFASDDETELYLHAWSKKVMPQCAVTSYPDAYKVADTGLWGEAVRQRRPVITNDYQSSPFRRGVPEGHVPVRNHMNLPVFDNNRIVILAGVGNKAGDYTEEDVQQLSLIMDGMWNIIKRKRTEEELRTVNENLEKIVEERTTELQQSNEELHYIIEKQAQTEVALARREALFRGVFDNASAAIVRLTPEGQIILANRICARLLGYTDRELAAKNMTDLLHPDNLSEALENFDAHIKKGDRTWFNERKMITKTGEAIWGALNMTTLLDRTGQLESLIVVATDITARVKAEQALTRSNAALEKSRKQLQIIIDNIPAVISYVDKELCYQFVNQQYEVMFKTRLEDLIGRHVATLIGEEAFEKGRHRYDGALAGEPQRFEMEFSNQGNDYILDVSYIPHEYQGVVEGIFILVVDMTERKKIENHLARLSNTDALTGAGNRRHFMEQARKEVARARRYHAPLSLLIFDIDHFKRINDSFGHNAGDEVLKGLVAAVVADLRDSDIFCRIGGEEFAVVLVETGIEPGQGTADRIRRLLENLEVRVNGQMIRFTVSVGLSQFRADGDDDLDRLMKRADNALYQAKEGGRNQVQVMP